MLLLFRSTWVRMILTEFFHYLEKLRAAQKRPRANEKLIKLLKLI